MLRKSVLVAVIAASLATPAMYAQRDNRSEKGVTTVINGSDDDADRVEKAMKENAPSAPNDNGLPRFTIMGKDHQFYVGVGAQFLGEAVGTFGANVGSPVLFTPSAMTAATPGNGGSLGFGWQSSSVYMNFVAMPGTDNQVGLFFKANFMGNNNAFNCYHFYARYRGLTAGYTTGVFTDAAAEPMTLDFEGPNGYPYTTLFTAYWQQKFTPNFSGAIGIDAPTASLTSGSHTSTVSQRIPAVPIYLQYAWKEGAGHLRLSGIVRPMQYRNMVASTNKTIAGLGVQLSGMTPVVGPLSVNYNVAYGKGIGSYIQDDNGLGLDAVEVGTSGKMEAVKTLGVTGGLSLAISPKVSVNTTYSHVVNSMPSDNVYEGNTYRLGDYVAANVIYTINKFVSAGIEYDYGHRKSIDGSSLHANRIQAQLAVTF